MGIKRYLASKDNTISNAFDDTLRIRATGSNMGGSDILETFSIYAQISSSTTGYSTEKSRILIQFPMDQIIADRQSGVLPSSGSVNFYFKLFNAKHGDTVPNGVKLVVAPISSSWEEGIGLDMEQYTDTGVSNWISSSDGVAWVSQGGDYHASPRFEQTFDKGTEDLELNVSELIEQWLAGTKQNYGFGVFITSSQENSTSRSYYTKKFFARGTEFFFKQPLIEARFNSIKKDNRGDFYYSSSLATSQENLNTIYLYNSVRGALRNIPSVGTGNVYVSIFSGSSDNTRPSGSSLTLVQDGTNVTVASPTVVTGGWVSTGVYSASFAITASSVPIETLYDVWHNGNLTTQFFTSSIEPKLYQASNNSGNEKYLIKLTNLKQSYAHEETGRIRLYARPKNWYPNIFSVAQSIPDTATLSSASYSIYRVSDDLQIIPHSTGSSTLHTLMSSDVSGNYFDFDMSILEPDYSYAFQVAIFNDRSAKWETYPESFKFRVEKQQTE